MMGAFILAWLVGEGIITYRSVKNYHAPPLPGELLVTSGVFVLLAILSESEKARPAAVTLAWGFNLAAAMNLFQSASSSAPIPGNVIPWPPQAADNTVVIPNGKLVEPTAASSSTASSSSTGTTLV